jgi:hypothetical protein
MRTCTISWYAGFPGAAVDSLTANTTKTASVHFIKMRVIILAIFFLLVTSIPANIARFINGIIQIEKRLVINTSLFY